MSKSIIKSAQELCAPIKGNDSGKSMSERTPSPNAVKEKVIDKAGGY